MLRKFLTTLLSDIAAGINSGKKRVNNLALLLNYAHHDDNLHKCICLLIVNGVVAEREELIAQQQSLLSN